MAIRSTAIAINTAVTASADLNKLLKKMLSNFARSVSSGLVKRLLLAGLVFASLDCHADWKRDFLWEIVPGASYKLESLVNSNDELLVGLAIIKSGLECDPQAANKIETIATDVSAWQERIKTDISAGKERWSNSVDDEERKAKDYVSFRDSIQLNDYKELVSQCAGQKKWGGDSVSLSGAEEWTRKRIVEYEQYLPRVTCDSALHDWMQVNYAAAKALLPVIVDDRAQGYKKWFEWSSLTREKYLQHRDLKIKHTTTYRREGKVIRKAAKRCSNES